jgi:hypothetical protein
MTTLSQQKALADFPITDPGERKRLVENIICPECGGTLDTGWECNSCGFDAISIGYTDLDKARECNTNRSER